MSQINQGQSCEELKEAIFLQYQNAIKAIDSFNASVCGIVPAMNLSMYPPANEARVTPSNILESHKDVSKVEPICFGCGKKRHVSYKYPMKQNKARPSLYHLAKSRNQARTILPRHVLKPTPTPNKAYRGKLPFCHKCEYHHKGVCRNHCMLCDEFGHWEKDCRIVKAHTEYMKKVQWEEPPSRQNQSWKGKEIAQGSSSMMEKDGYPANVVYRAPFDKDTPTMNKYQPKEYYPRPMKN